MCFSFSPVNVQVAVAWVTSVNIKFNCDYFLCLFHSDGTGRTGTYILIDMVLNRMAKGDFSACIDLKSLCLLKFV